MKSTGRRPFDLSVVLRGFLIEWSRPASAALFSFLIFSLIAQVKVGVLSATENNYYNYLADAFLHGQMHLRLVPPSHTDLVLFDGKYFLYWPPLPALMLAPWVAVFGVNFSDVLLTVVLGSIDIAFMAAILAAACRRGELQLEDAQRGRLVIFFALGTMITPMIPFGNIWATSQLAGTACLGLAYWAALRFRGWRAFLLAGVGMGAALATRNSLVLLGVWPAWVLLREHWQLPRGRLARLILLALLPFLASLAVLGWYNFSRFGNFFEVGLPYHQMNDVFRSAYEQYGVFNLHYLPTNLYYQFIFYPFPVRADSAMGGSLFLLSPLFFAALWSLWQDRRRLSTWACLITFLLGYLPIGLLMGTGSMQYGPRYLLDVSIPLMLLTAQGMRRWSPGLVSVLVLVSVIHYLLGVSIFLR